MSALKYIFYVNLFLYTGFFLYIFFSYNIFIENLFSLLHYLIIFFYSILYFYNFKITKNLKRKEKYFQFIIGLEILYYILSLIINVKKFISIKNSTPSTQQQQHNIRPTTILFYIVHHIIALYLLSMCLFFTEKKEEPMNFVIHIISLLNISSIFFSLKNIFIHESPKKILHLLFILSFNLFRIIILPFYIGLNFKNFRMTNKFIRISEIIIFIFLQLIQVYVSHIIFCKND